MTQNIETAIDALQAAAWPQTLVWHLYYTVLADPELSPYFKGVNVAGIIDKQIKMFKAIGAGTIPPYSKEQLGKVHQHLKVPNEHFSKLLKLVLETYMFYNVSAADTAVVLAALEGYRTAIVTASSSEG